MADHEAARADEPEGVELSGQLGCQCPVAALALQSCGHDTALAVGRAIPSRLYETAAVEGASPWFTVRWVTLRLMAPVLVLLAVRDAVLVIQVTFVPVLLVTAGGPRESTLTPPFVLYERAFLYGELGYASTLSMVLLISTAVVVAVLALLARPWLRRVL